MTKTTKEERDEIRLLEARATLGPWLQSESTRVPKVLDRDGGLVCEFDTVNGKNDREAVAAMRNIVPDLLADLDAAEAKLEAVTDVPDDIHAAIEELAESAYAWADSDTEPVSEQAAKERIADSRLRVMVNRLLAQRDRAESERDALKAKLAALVDFNVAELGRTRKEVWPDCEYCRDSTHDHECAGPVPNPRWVELSAAIAAARGGAQ